MVLYLSFFYKCFLFSILAPIIIIPKKQLKLHFLLGVEVQKSLRAYKGIGRGLRVSWFGSVGYYLRFYGSF